MKVLREFFSSGVVNRATNETYICLIPKKTNSFKLADFKPISLITSLYKIITKVLVGRLKEVLESTTSFVRNRQILDAVLVANEVVDEIRLKKKKGLVFKIDFGKAYDHVD